MVLINKIFAQISLPCCRGPCGDVHRMEFLGICVALELKGKWFPGNRKEGNEQSTSYSSLSFDFSFGWKKN